VGQLAGDLGVGQRAERPSRWASTAADGPAGVRPSAAHRPHATRARRSAAGRPDFGGEDDGIGRSPEPHEMSVAVWSVVFVAMVRRGPALIRGEPPQTHTDSINGLTRDRRRTPRSG
jgi:hypothetical protein